MIYIIRHGQTKMNNEQALQGRSNHPLNETGCAQAEQVAAWFQKQGIVFDRVYSSPLLRAVQTAKIVAGEDAEIITDDRLLEMDYGPYEGISLKNPPQEILDFFMDFANTPAPEGMEQLSSVVKRAGDFMETLKDAGPEETILIATHAIAMKGVLEYLTPDRKDYYWSKHILNCSVYSTELSDGKFRVPEEIEMNQAG